MQFVVKAMAYLDPIMYQGFRYTNGLNCQFCGFLEVFNPSSVSKPHQQRSDKVVKGVSTHWMTPRTLAENEAEEIERGLQGRVREVFFVLR